MHQFGNVGVGNEYLVNVGEDETLDLPLVAKEITKQLVSLGEKGDACKVFLERK